MAQHVLTGTALTFENRSHWRASSILLIIGPEKKLDAHFAVEVMHEALRPAYRIETVTAIDAHHLLDEVAVVLQRTLISH